MSALRRLQQDFAHSLQALAPDPLIPWLRGSHAASRANLYARNVQSIFVTAMGAVYPVIARLLGARCFDGLTRRYARLYPATSGDLHDYGAAFADFLRNTPLTTTLPYLPDVARLEWAYHRLFHAAQVPPLTREDLTAVAPTDYARLGFALAPSSALLSADYPVHLIWAANQANRDGEVNLISGVTRLLLHRPEHAVEMIPIGAGEYAFLQALQLAQPLAAAMDAALAAEPGMDPAHLLVQHIVRGTLVTFHIHEEAQA